MAILQLLLQDENGNWLNQTNRNNSTADASPTASQMPRSLGIALASKLYRANHALAAFDSFSNNGNEISFVSIGDASTSEGLFWETLNAAGVMRVPLAISVWDDGYGISVPQKYQTTKENISGIIEGFQADEQGRGLDIYVCEGWNYPKLVETYKRGIEKMRKTHIPALFHIKELTQPQGHSTSGSHERYKNANRLEWERDFDCIKKMREWMISSGIATESECDVISEDAKAHVAESKRDAWRKFAHPLKQEIEIFKSLAGRIGEEMGESDKPQEAIEALQKAIDPVRKDILKAGKKLLRHYRGQEFAALNELRNWLKNFEQQYRATYDSHHHSES